MILYKMIYNLIVLLDSISELFRTNDNMNDWR
jgi:hypothetical protein